MLLHDFAWEEGIAATAEVSFGPVIAAAWFLFALQCSPITSSLTDECGIQRQVGLSSNPLLCKTLPQSFFISSSTRMSLFASAFSPNPSLNFRGGFRFASALFFQAAHSKPPAAKKTAPCVASGFRSRAAADDGGCG